MAVALFRLVDHGQAINGLSGSGMCISQSLLPM